MANVLQWPVDQFYGQLQLLENRIKAVDASLNADKAELQAAYTAARNDPDQARGGANRLLLDRQIHRNTELRLSYLKPIRDKFNQAVALSTKVLRSAGVIPPTLSGLGIAVVLAPAAAVTLVVVAVAAIGSVALLTESQRVRTRALTNSLVKAKTPDEVQQILDASARELKAEGDAHPPLGLDLGAVVPILGLVAVIMFLPRVLEMLPKRRAAA